MKKSIILFISYFICSLLYANNSMIYKGKDGFLFPVWEKVDQSNLSEKKQLVNSVDLICFTKNILQEHNISLIVMPVPMRTRVLQEHLPDNKIMSLDVQNRYEQLIQLLNKNQIMNINVYQYLENLDNKKPLYFKTDQHWKPETAEKIAYAIAQDFQDKLPKPVILYKPYKGTLSREAHKGDLISSVSKDQQGLYPLENFNVSYWNKEDLQNITENYEITLVGNSLVNPYLGFIEHFSNAIKQNVFLHWNYGDLGPWKNLTLYLSSDEFKRHKPKVIIWQMNEINLIYGPNSPLIWRSGSSLSESDFKSIVNTSFSDKK